MFSQKSSKVQAIILAGGFGTRINHLLGDKPKPLAQVNGHPFLFWIISYILTQGIADIAFSTHYKADQIKDFVDQFKIRLRSCICVYENEPLGTAGGALNVVKNLPEKKNLYLILNGDSLFPIDLGEAINAINSGAQAVMIGAMMPDTSRYGNLRIDQNGRLLGFVEKGKSHGEGLINAGIYLFTDSALENYMNLSAPLSFEYDLIPSLVEKGVDIRVIKGDVPFLDIGTEDSFFMASNFIKKLLDEKLLMEI